MNTKNRKQHKAVGLATKKNIAFVLVCLFVFTNWMGLPDLPGFPNLPDFPNLPSFLNPSRSGAAAYAAGDPGWEAGPGEILVFSQAEFKSAVEAPDPVLPARSLYHTIYLGADITFTTAAQTASFGNEANYSRGSLTIDGTNPKTGIVHTITSNFAVITRNGTVAQMPNNESYTFRNIKLRSSANANGFFSFGTAANSAKAKINFENADIVAYRTVFSNTLSNLSSQAKVEIMDSYIESTNNGDVSLIYCGNLILTGEVTINSMTRSVFRLGNSQKTWSLTVTEGADVRIANKNIDSSYSALFYSLALINAIDIGEGASFYYTGRQFARTDTSAVNTGYWINTLTVDKNAVLKLNLIGSNTGYNKLRAHNIVVNEGATLAAYALAGTTSTATNNTGTASAHPAVQADVLELNNPFRVTVGVGNPAATATGNWNALFQNSMTIKAKGIKSIRYYIDGGSQSFDSGGNYIGDRRTDYTRWWFQESGVFGFEVQNIGQMTPSVMSQSYDTAGNAAVAAEPKFEGPDVSAGPVRVVQIDGGSRSPTIDAVYVGASKVTGVGVPGAEVTITWPTMNQISATPVTTVTVAPDGTWQAFVPGDLFLDISSIFEESKIKAVQCEDVYGFSRGDSYPVFADVRGTTLKVLGNNMRNIYYNSGETPDVADVIFYGAGETVVLEEQAGRYLITNKAVPDMNDVSAFESMYTETGSMHKGYLAAETGVFFKQELRDIPANCTVWVMATLLYGGSENTIGDALTYTNLYERRDIYVRLVEGPLGAPVGGLYVIIPYTQLAGNYGIPYDLNGAVLTGPSARYSRANLEINSVFSDYWTASTKDGGDTPRTIVLDAGFPQSYIALSDDAEGLRYTLYLEKIMLPDPRWVQVPVRYVDCVGNAIDTGEPAAIDHIWVPLDLTEQEDDRPDPPEGEELEPLPPIIESSCSAFLERGGYFIPGKYFPYSPVGYYTSNTGAIDVREDEGDPLKMTACTDFAKEFEPRMEDIAHIPQEILYIVYDQGYISVREIHETEAGAPIHDERKTSVKIEEGKEPPRYTAPRVTGYVPVGYKVNNLNGAYEDRFIYSPAPGYPPSMDQNGLIYVDITQSMIMTGFVGDAEEIEIVWIYAPDADGLGIPDDSKVRVIVQWHGQIVNNPFPAILKDTQYITTRKGFGITFTNDGSEQGNPEDRIVINFGVYEGAWMFDKENPTNAAIREIVPTEREEVIFYYAYSSDGMEPDNRQYVDINRITWDDNLGDNESAPPEPVGKAYVLHGQRFSHMPGELEGYVYYGYRLDNDQDVQVTYENGVSHKAIEFHTSENNHTVTLVYIKKGGAVTVIWEGETSAGNTVILYRKEYAGYVGEQVVVDQNSVLLADVWLFETGQPLTHVFTLGNFPQEEKFMYRESEPDDDFIYVTVKGVEGATVHYSYVKRIAKSGLPAVLTSPADVFDIPGYKLDEASDFVVTESTREKIFNYASLATTVAIKMVDSGGADVAAHFTVSAVAGQPFSYYAPDVPGHFLTGSASGSVSEVREDGASEIVFTYAQVNSKVTIIAKENDTDGKVIGVYEVAAPIQGAQDYDAPDLSGDFYTALTLTVAIDWDGTNAVSVEAYYAKDFVSITIHMVNQNGGAAIDDPIVAPGKRQGEAVIVDAPSLSGWVLVGAFAQTVIADTDAQVTFAYRALAADEVLVKAVDKGDGAVLYNFALAGTLGETITVGTPFILGWAPADAGTQSAEIGVDKEIVFAYDKSGEADPADPPGDGDSDSGDGDGDGDGGSGGGGSGDGDGDGDSGGSGSGGDGGSDGGGGSGGGGGSSSGSGGGGGYTAATASSDGKAFLSAANDKIKETLEMSAHIKYIGGYPDETVRPDGEITRAEVAVIFWRLLRIPAKYAFVDHTFGDVAEDEWYAQAVKYLAKMGILKGYGDGTYKPSQTITRAEFAAIASRFDDPVTDVDNPFIDLPAAHWAYADITTAYVKGWISGYPGGAFKPQDNITRGEVVAIINRVLGRAIAKDDVSANFRTLYSDLPITHWAFAAVIEASVSHEYERKEDGYEIWIAISRN